VHEIGEFAFSSCSNLAQLQFGRGVTEIGARAFNQCTSLREITIPESVTRIEKYAFCSCANMTKVTIGKHVTKIGNAAFGACRRLSAVYFEGNPPAYQDQDEPFWNTVNVTVYYRPAWGPTYGGRTTAVWKQ
jgi:hypothetical protein